jgi:crotonobetainyl-CoA:carnitine CoA-transferase CaiB-like acyl-CoA transferase
VETIEHAEAGTYAAVRNPVRIDGRRRAIGAAPPSLGQHTGAVLREIGVSRRDIAAMRQRGAI